MIKKSRWIEEKSHFFKKKHLQEKTDTFHWSTIVVD